jgi:hypothetical protein
VLAPKSAALPTTSPTTNQKKRKLSDPHPGPKKLAKTPKKDENSPKCLQKKTKVVTNADNEVSSSSEADQLQKTRSPPNLSSKPKVVGLLDKFVRTTQQLEVSTSTCGGGEFIDIDDSDNEAEGKDISVNRKCDVSDAKPSDERKENVDTIVDEPVESHSKACVSTDENKPKPTVDTTVETKSETSPEKSGCEVGIIRNECKIAWTASN